MVNNFVMSPRGVMFRNAFGRNLQYMFVNFA